MNDAGGCRIAMRPEHHPLGAAMRADCTWPDVSVDALVALVSDYSRYPEFVFPVAESRVRRTEGDRALVYQRQQVFGLADREVLLWMQQERGTDRLRVSWTTASEEPLELARGAIRTPRNQGFWEITADPEGGAHVVHEVALDAGGSVPRWIVALVRTRSFAKILADVRRKGLVSASG
ncbi:MAG: SRPBCC family protein [Myxococcota bacterium]